MGDRDLILPDENPRLDWKRYYLRVDFHPSIKLNRRDCLRFAEAISEFLELEDVQPSTVEWKMDGGASCDGVHVRIAKTSITFDVHDPVNNLEWYEHRFEPVIGKFRGMFAPHVTLRRNAMVSCLLDMPEGADARAFLGGWVMLMDPHKLAPIERPLYVLGVRLFFPPFDEPDADSPEKSRSVDWSVNVRVESFISDIRKLFMEADADWDEPILWDDDLAGKAFKCLAVVTDFTSDKIVKFLRQPPLPDGDEDSDG